MLPFGHVFICVNVRVMHVNIHIRNIRLLAYRFFPLRTINQFFFFFENQLLISSEPHKITPRPRSCFHTRTLFTRCSRALQNVHGHLYPASHDFLLPKVETQAPKVYLNTNKAEIYMLRRLGFSWFI